MSSVVDEFKTVEIFPLFHLLPSPAGIPNKGDVISQGASVGDCKKN